MQPQPNGTIARLAPLLLAGAALLVGCEPPKDSEISVIPRAAVGADQVVAQKAGVDLSENASALATVDGTPEVVVTSNGGFNISNQYYGCSRDNYATWRTFTIGGLSNILADPSIIGRFAGPPSGNMFYMEMLSGNGSPTGVTIMKSHDPCPASGNPVWTRYTIGLNPDGSNDYPRLKYNDRNDTIWLLWKQLVQNPGMTPPQNLVLFALQIGDNGQIGNAIPMFCSDVRFDDMNVYDADVDSAGNIHVAFLDWNQRLMRHVKFDTHTSAWQCPTQKIGNYAQPRGSCGALCAGTPMYQNVTAGACLRETITPTLTVNRRTGTMIVSYPTQGGVDDSCANTITNTRWYRSTDSGATWTWQAYTGCITSLQPVSRAGGVGTQVNFHTMMTMDAQNGRNDAAQVHYKSTNDGVSWSGIYVSATRPFRVVGPVGGSCYWGDYTAMTNDNGRSRIFMNWSDANGTNSVLHGVTDDL
jgi:hypothetical protein